MSVMPMLSGLRPDAGAPFPSATPFFLWDAETAQPPPSIATFTRASTAQVLTTTDGTTFWYQEAKSGELRLEGMRRQENILGATAWELIGTTTRTDLGNGVSEFSNLQDASFDRARVLVNTGDTTGRRYAGYIEAKGVAGETIALFIKREGGGGFAGSTISVTLAADWKKYYIGEYTAVSGNTQVSVGIANIGSTADIIQVRSEGGTVVDGAPANSVPEVLARNEEYNADVNDVKYYNTVAANTSSPATAGEITEATGATITGGGYLSEPEAANYMSNTDLATWSEGGGGEVIVTDNGINSLGLHEYELDAGTQNVQHRIFNFADLGFSGSSYILAKEGTGRYIVLRRGNSPADDYACFDLQAGSVTEEGAGIDNARIELVSDGWYKCIVETSDAGTDVHIGLANTGTPGAGDASFPGSNETVFVCHTQYESNILSTSPIITSGSTVTREADSLTDAAWPAEASAVVDTTVASAIPGGDDATRQNMLGFGSGANRNFQIFASNQAALINGGISSTITASSSYEGERHSFGMSLTINEGIVVDDEDNDNTDVTGTPSQGTIYIASNSLLQTVPAIYHQIKIFAQTLTVEELKGQLP